jgi:hypothetical protein
MTRWPSDSSKGWPKDVANAFLIARTTSQQSTSASWPFDVSAKRVWLSSMCVVAGKAKKIWMGVLLRCQAARARGADSPSYRQHGMSSHLVSRRRRRGKEVE